MALKAAFIFVAPGADASKHKAVVNTPEVTLTTVGVSDYAQAEAAAKDLVSQGIGAIELCGGFGTEGVARIKRAVAGKAVVQLGRLCSRQIWLQPGLDPPGNRSLGKENRDGFHFDNHIG